LIKIVKRAKAGEHYATTIAEDLQEYCVDCLKVGSQGPLYKTVRASAENKQSKKSSGVRDNQVRRNPSSRLV
jgi:hypothetical protein